MVRFLDSSFSSRMEELKPLFFRSGHYATWMINLCKMTSIPILFIEWIVKMRNYQFSKNPRGAVVGAKDRGLQMWSPLSPPRNTMQYGVRNRSKLKCGMHIYSRRTICLPHGKRLRVFLQKYLWVRPEVSERGQRLKLWLCKLKIKKFSVPFMAIRLLNCIQKR